MVESLWLEVSNGNKKYVVVGIYRHPKLRAKILLRHLLTAHPRSRSEGCSASTTLSQPRPGPYGTALSNWGNRNVLNTRSWSWLFNHICQLAHITLPIMAQFFHCISTKFPHQTRSWTSSHIHLCLFVFFFIIVTHMMFHLNYRHGWPVLIG